MTTTRETPRVDALVNCANAAGRSREQSHEALVDLARTLERELAAKDATIAELREALDRLAYQANIVAPTVGMADAISNANRLLAALAKVPQP